MEFSPAFVSLQVARKRVMASKQVDDRRRTGGAKDPINVDSSNSGQLDAVVSRQPRTRPAPPSTSFVQGSARSDSSKKRKTDDPAYIRTMLEMARYMQGPTAKSMPDGLEVRPPREAQSERLYNIPVGQPGQPRGPISSASERSQPRPLAPMPNRDSFRPRESTRRPDDIYPPTIHPGLPSEKDELLPYATLLPRNSYVAGQQEFGNMQPSSEVQMPRLFTAEVPGVPMHGPREIALTSHRQDGEYLPQPAYPPTSQHIIPRIPSIPPTPLPLQHPDTSNKPRGFAPNQEPPTAGYERVIFHPKTGYPQPPTGHPDPDTPIRQYLPATAPRPSLPVWTSVAPKDAKYEARLQSNEQRTPLVTQFKTPAPVWALKRRGLTSALEYYRDPIATTGGSVCIGEAGFARSIMLEGSLGDGYGFWGTGKSVGTFVVPFGNARRRGQFRKPDAAPHADSELTIPAKLESNMMLKPVDPIPLPRKSTQSPQVTVAIARVRASSQYGQEPYQPPAPADEKQELFEVEALLRSHRAGMPVAVGISEDCTLVPFKVSRPFLILGWFWITDAWPEPVGEAWSDLEISNRDLQNPEVKIRWRFRFDWCTGDQEPYPWWETRLATGDPLFWSMARMPVECRPGTADDPKVSLTESVQLAIEKDEDRAPDHWKACISCGSRSIEVYNGKHYCLNIDCDQWFYDNSANKDDKAPRRIILRMPRQTRRVLPNELDMKLSPPVYLEPAVPQVEDAGKIHWRGWACPRCGCTSERRQWKGWDCEGCSNKWYPDRKIWSAVELMPVKGRDLNFNTSPTLDDTAQFIHGTTRTSAIWRDGTKACSYGLPNSSEVHHLLASPTPTTALKTNEILQVLQERDWVNFRRTPDQQPGTRATEKCYSPLYTFLAGPAETPMLEGLPSYKPVSWQVAPRVCVQAIGRINDTSTRILSDEKRFNSLLLACAPPDLPAELIPWIRIPQYSTFAIMYLGSKGHVRVVEPERSRKKAKQLQGQLELRHGDITLIKTFDAEVDVGLVPAGFGFFCIGRQIYPPEDPARDGSGQPLTLAKPKSQPIPPREWPGDVVSVADMSDMAPGLKQDDLSVEKQGWHMGNIRIWNSDKDGKVEQEEHAALPTPAKSTPLA
ncbi:hypothetical protein QFC21_001144 [Naganishia friedmannii]|uniref:Uncharacterized protein n=1 Tax=Naganishia friedmannii TaxID=89922 RepID=A0ACC2W910_9TREE|nr:hypothetical protein QFC21_001144 [Naganishia friedmannii]